MQNSPSRWKLEPPPWVALGQYEGENESLWGGCAGSDPGHQQTHKCEIHFERWAADKATKEKKIISPHLIQNFFSTIFRTLLSLPPNYTALLTTSYSRWLWVLIKYSYIIKIRQKCQRWWNSFSQKKTKYCVMNVSHFTPLSLSVHQSTGSHMTHACWVCYHSYNTIFFSLPDNHLPLVSSNRVARLKVLYEVKMLIFCQHTGKTTTDLYEWKKVLQRSGRHAAAPSHGGPRQPDATCDTAGEEGESVYHFEIQLTPLFAGRVWQDISQWRQSRSAFASKTWKNKESPRKGSVTFREMYYFFCCLDLFGFYYWKQWLQSQGKCLFLLLRKRNFWRWGKSNQIMTLVQII